MVFQSENEVRLKSIDIESNRFVLRLGQIILPVSAININKSRSVVNAIEL